MLWDMSLVLKEVSCSPSQSVGVMAGCLAVCRGGGWLPLVFIACPPALAPDLCWGALQGMEDITHPFMHACMHVIRRLERSCVPGHPAQARPTSCASDCELSAAFFQRNQDDSQRAHAEAHSAAARGSPEKLKVRWHLDSRRQRVDDLAAAAGRSPTLHVPVLGYASCQHARRLPASAFAGHPGTTAAALKTLRAAQRGSRWLTSTRVASTRAALH